MNKNPEILSVIKLNSAGGEADFENDVIKGLTSHPKSISAKYFYDHEGSLLFEDICKTQDYYPTRTEEKILQDNIEDIFNKTKNVKCIVELGSGTSVKTKTILKYFATHPVNFVDTPLERGFSKLEYFPIDVSDILETTVEKLKTEFPSINITGIMSEYEEGIEKVNELNNKPKLIIFLGSSIGNFTPAEATNLLKVITANMTDDDFFLIGFDMIKDRQILHKAYNDSDCVTEAFNLNLLKRINGELGAEFNLNNFSHHAFFNEQESRIEMHLVSKNLQYVKFRKQNKEIFFDEGESIHTENSYKFSNEMVLDITTSAGLQKLTEWKDENKYFSLWLFKKS
ncbi:MAG TPA: L-histidine N(alpha)-methyltransferase [Ignavibacteria bacterium]|nr:L-histidine N(alpha)-methyltransferase [Ignavibacteria bacterium]